MPTFPFSEKHLSQIPALQQLMNMGYRYLPPEKAMVERGGRAANVLLESILRDQLKKINRIRYKGKVYLFSEENIQSAIQKIKNVQYDGLQKTNEAIYDLITLGTSLEQTIESDSKSYTLNYIDWKNPANNVFHATAEFSVERARSTETARPDIVLFVNGIPLVVIECKGPDVDVDQAISQTIRNQGEEYIPRLFIYAQILLALNKNEAKYATVGTSKAFWSIWDELEDTDEVNASINTPLSAEDKDALFRGDFALAEPHFTALESTGDRLVTEQDRCLHSLCRPERLLELIYGIVWHTQGSGKSITMVMLARALALDLELNNARMILVTDRKDLDKQLGNTFAACGLIMERATTGRNLVKHIKNEVGIITTLINKFDTALSAEKYVDDSANIVVLVDESHRTNFGSLAARMRFMLPNACYIGFTGTPLLKREKNSFARFGGLIEPHYSVRQAIKDKAVVPLLYEGRHVEIEQNQNAVDLWFERHTANLTEQQKADLKRKYARADALNQADQAVYMRAFDISEHYRANWQDTGFKAQLVAPNKATALKYREFFNEINAVSSEVVISSPDMREGHEEVGEETDVVNAFWTKMMARYGSEDQYNKQIIAQFKRTDDPEILIVVDKLITGFDAPRNTVLYLCRKLREHTLLQAIARVNRVHENKEFGYVVDYANVLGELDKALTEYDALADFDGKDLADVLISIHEEIQKLPQRYSDLWDIFKEIKNSRDEERYEVLLSDDALREDFYERLTEYGKTLAIALSSEQFLMQTDEARLKRYKSDLLRFEKLRRAVKLRYAEAIDYGDYDTRIKKLLNTHIQANEVTQLNAPVNIFDDNTFSLVRETQGIYRAQNTAANADHIAHATRRKITENMDKDPAFYQKFSKLIQEAIDDFRQQRILALDYLQKVSDIRDKVENTQRDDVPDAIRNNREACAYFGAIKPCLSKIDMDDSQTDDIAIKTTLAIQTAIDKNWKVDFWNDSDAQNTVKNEIDDFFYDVVEDGYGIDLSSEQMDEMISQTMQIAKFWRPA